MRIDEIAKHRILILDGAIGTMIQAILAHGERLQRVRFADAGGHDEGKQRHA